MVIPGTRQILKREQEKVLFRLVWILLLGHTHIKRYGKIRERSNWFIAHNLCPWACLHTDFIPYAPLICAEYLYEDRNAK